jgi:hypothetical protein
MKRLKFLLKFMIQSLMKARKRKNHRNQLKKEINPLNLKNQRLKLLITLIFKREREYSQRFHYISTYHNYVRQVYK